MKNPGTGDALGVFIKATPIVDDNRWLQDGITAWIASPLIISTIVMLLLYSLGLDAKLGTVPFVQILTFMAIGSGAMVSTTAYRAQTLITLMDGISGIVLVSILELILL
ncbi:membrane hypothetical protein [Brevibacillus sp. IT-7CA2]